MNKTFKLRAKGQKKYFTVIVYDKLEDLRREANEHDKRAGVNDVDHNEVFGVVHSFERIRIEKNGKETPHDQIGIIRFSKKHLRTHVVFHEAMHAALWQFRLSNPERDANFGEQCSPKEEEFLHLAEKVFMDMVRKMYKHGFWK